MSRNPDTLVIGGGVIGLAVALRLRQAGLAVTLLERGHCGGEASWAGAGIISPANPHRTDALYDMHIESVQRYAAFCAELTELTGIDTHYENCGALDLLTTEQSVQMAESDVRATAGSKTEAGLPILELITPEECSRIESVVTGECPAVLHCRRTAQVRNPRLLAAMRTACDRVGVVIREQTPVRSFLRDGARVVGVQAEAESYPAGKIVLAAGAWSSQFDDPQLSEAVPVFPVRGQIVLLKMPNRLFERVITKKQAYLVPRRDGHVLVGATHEPEARFERRNTAKGVAWLMEQALAMVPGLADAPVAGMWSGFRPATADQRPHIGPVPGFDGLIAATGHYRTGLTLAPITADIVKELVVDGRTSWNLSRCAPGRAASGS